jgi:hypothetical protein
VTLLLEAPPDRYVAPIVDSIGRILADALGGDDKVFAAGQTEEVMDEEPLVEPLTDDFWQANLPCGTVALGKWTIDHQTYGITRVHMTVNCALWRGRVPLNENIVGLYNDLDNVIRSFRRHEKAYLAPGVQSATLHGGPGVRPRSMPRRGGQTATALFLMLPFTVDVVIHTTFDSQPG